MGKHLALKDGAENKRRRKTCFQHAGFSPVPPRILFPPHPPYIVLRPCVAPDRPPLKGTTSQGDLSFQAPQGRSILARAF